MSSNIQAQRLLETLIRLPQTETQLLEYKDCPTVLIGKLIQQREPKVLRSFTASLINSAFPKEQLAMVINVVAQKIFELTRDEDADSVRFSFVEKLLEAAKEAAKDKEAEDCILQQAELVAKSITTPDFFMDLAIGFLEFPFKDSDAAKVTALGLFKKMKEFRQYSAFFIQLILGTSNCLKGEECPRISIKTVEFYLPAIQKALKKYSAQNPQLMIWKNVFSAFINTPLVCIDEELWKEGVLQSNSLLENLQKVKEECDRSSSSFITKLKECMTPKNEVDRNMQENARLIFFLIKKVYMSDQLSKDENARQPNKKVVEFQDFKKWISETFSIYPEDLIEL